MGTLTEISINDSYDCMFWYIYGGGFKPPVLITYVDIIRSYTMSLSDTIDAIIKESTSVERELRWFLSALPAIVSTEHLKGSFPASPSPLGVVAVLVETEWPCRPTIRFSS